MKVKTTYRLTSICLAVAVASFGFGACHSDDYKTDDDSATSDSAAVSRVDNTRNLTDMKDTVGAEAIPVESSAASAASASTSAASGSTAASRTAATSAGSVRHPAGAAKKYRTFIAIPENSAKTEMVKDKDGIYNMAQVQPQFPGGHKALENFINNHLDYPDQAIDDNASGTVKISFVVDENGKVMNPRVVSGQRIGDGLEQQAIRAVSSMPDWKPGKVHGKNVKTRLELPINFQLDV